MSYGSDINLGRLACFVHFCKKVGDSDLVLLGKTLSSKTDELPNKLI